MLSYRSSKSTAKGLCYIRAVARCIELNLQGVGEWKTAILPELEWVPYGPLSHAEATERLELPASTTIRFQHSSEMMASKQLEGAELQAANVSNTWPSCSTLQDAIRLPCWCSTSTWQDHVTMFCELHRQTECKDSGGPVGPPNA